MGAPEAAATAAEHDHFGVAAQDEAQQLALD
jgi:hypothetical protein